MIDYNDRVPKLEIWYAIPGIAGIPKGEEFKDVFKVEAKSNLSCLVVVLEAILKIYKILSILHQFQQLYFFANKFSINIKVTMYLARKSQYIRG